MESSIETEESVKNVNYANTKGILSKSKKIVESEYSNDLKNRIANRTVTLEQLNELLSVKLPELQQKYHVFVL